MTLARGSVQGGEATVLPGWLRLTRTVATGGAVLVYHGVERYQRDDDVASMHVSLDRLAETLRAVKQIGTIVSLQDMVSRHLRGRSTKGLVAVTFDDGYESVRSRAHAVLLAESVPATLFVVTDHARSGEAFWWDRVEQVLRHVAPDRWRLFGSRCGIPGSFWAEHARGMAPLWPLRQWVLARHQGRWPAALEEVLAELEGEVGSRATQRPLTFAELDDLMRSPLIEVATHTMSHSVLPSLPDEELRQEMRESFRTLCDRYSNTVPFLAPPFGLYDERTARVAKEEGLNLCLTLEATLLNDSRPGEAIPRIGLTARHRPWKVVLSVLGCWPTARPRSKAAPRYPHVPVAPAPPRPRAESALPARERRRVLFLLEDLGGGTGNHVCRMVSEWPPLGWDVVMVTQQPPLVRRLPDDIDVRVVKRTGWYDRFPVAQVRRLIGIRRLVRALKPDIVHTYFFWSIIYGRILKLLGEIPHLVENREDLGFNWSRGDYAVLRITRAIPDRIVCVADAVQQVTLAREGARPDRTTVVHNGVETSPQSRVPQDIARRTFGFSDEHLVVGMVANLPRAVKGGRRLLDAVNAVVGAVPTARFLLVGQGTEARALDPELRARGISHCVVGTGYRTDIEACYAAMDISVLTSSSEGLSITLLESMQHGLPVVVTRVGGNPEVVVDGVTGFLVPVHDVDAFVTRIIELARDPVLRRKLGAAGRRRVAERFAITDVARRYLDVYEELLGNPRRSPVQDPGDPRDSERRR